MNDAQVRGSATRAPTTGASNGRSGFPGRIGSRRATATRNPVAAKHPEYAGSWLAGFAPVGNTGYVVIVQTREDDALESELSLARQLAKWAGISASPGLLVVLLAAWHLRARTARTRLRRGRGGD